ncbi:DUF397 domain-containing protein [Streptomyces sp. NPDC001678]|uniref:DUF397 domain-containing protein n=1 Tax=Streptomyces sp. NPDC001678 TaxID=3364599 RepID=UPI003695B4EC
MTHIRALSGAEWTKSSYSAGNEGQCVEFARNLAGSGIVPVRDSKNPQGSALAFTPAAWAAFTRALR